MKKIQHFVITRFNLKMSDFISDKSGVSTQSEDWLNHRFKLFEKYCLPSLSAQTNKDFIWFIFFDESTPEKYKQKMIEAEKKCPQIQTCYMSGSDINTVLHTYIDKETDILITTRIDNDDAFREDALSVIRQQLDGITENIVVNLRFGYSYDGKFAEVFSQKHNPFSSLIEFRKGDKFVTIFSEARHGKIHRIAKVRQIPSGPYWLMVVHERNQTNRMSYDYRTGNLFNVKRFKRFLKKYVLHNIRRYFRPAAFRKRYELHELADKFHIKIDSTKN